MIELQGVSKIYRMRSGDVRALDRVDLTVASGDMVAVMGASGSGKSTMMNILGCLDTPSEGRYLLDGTDVGSLRDRRLADIRNQKIGFVFQAFNLIPRVSAVRNVEMPLMFAGVGGRRERAMAALERVGLADRARHTPAQLSGGQQQRVAIARAIVTEPVMVLADEPTGNLDGTATADLMGLFVELNEAGRTVVLITHEDDVAGHAGRVVSLRDGHVASDQRSDRQVQAGT